MYPPRPTHGVKITDATTVAELMEELTYLRFFFAVIGDGILGSSAVTVVNNEYRLQNGIDPPEGY